MRHNLIRTLAMAASALLISFHRSRGCVAAANTYDAAVETHGDSVRRTNDVAVTDRHLLWVKGANDYSVALGAAATIPLGVIDNKEPLTGAGLTVLLLGKGKTKKMVANEAITAGEQVYTAASGKVQDLPVGAGTYYLVGTALTAAAADGDIIEVQDCVPVRTIIT